MKIKHVAAAVALVCAGAPAFAVGIFNEFTVNETVVPGTGATFGNPALVADKLNGAYAERLTATSATTFSARAVATFTTFFSNDGESEVIDSALGGQPRFGGYGIYALFSATGTITGPNSFTSDSNSFQLFLDPDQNSTFTLTNGLVAPVGAGTGEDILLATAGTPVPSGSGSGNLNGPPGAFNIDWSDFMLTPFGSSFFVSPVPFYMDIRVNGDYDRVNPTPGQPGTRTITGDVSAVFPVPEPTSLALAGLALAGLGVVARRKAAKKA